ncbi:GNAT family N-acetyltransferase, partial [Angustibacter aerolatus]
MQTRPATYDDVPALTALQGAYATRWFGAPEEDEAELRQQLEFVGDLDQRTRLLLDGERLLGAAWWWSGGSAWAVHDPALDDELAAMVDDALLAWLRECGVTETEALAADVVAQQALQRNGWRHERSSFELVRPVSDDWVLPEPVLPPDVQVRPIAADEQAAVHEMVYERAGWADVPGHHVRPLDDWRQLFLGPDAPPEQQLAAWAGDVPVGVVLGKVFSDGTGWVAHLAVDRARQGLGLGLALLLPALRDRAAA